MDGENVWSVLVLKKLPNRRIVFAGIDPAAEFFGDQVRHSTTMQLARGQRVPMAGAP